MFNSLLSYLFVDYCWRIWQLVQHHKHWMHRVWSLFMVWETMHHQRGVLRKRKSILKCSHRPYHDQLCDWTFASSTVFTIAAFDHQYVRWRLMATINFMLTLVSEQHKHNDAYLNNLLILHVFSLLALVLNVRIFIVLKRVMYINMYAFKTRTSVY